ncbi:MAG: CocE/NonD family hydrolase [Promethearchaeota archaeon]
MIKESPFDYKYLKAKKSKYKGFIATSHYITMRDGVKIAAEVLLPKKLPSIRKLPTILIQTRYWRAVELKKPFSWLVKFATNPLYCKNMVKYGFAVVETDVRGTGASEGIRPYPFSEEEIKDGYEVADWIIAQSWSDGTIATWGNSYTGITSELSATLNHPAIKCHIFKHNPFDLYKDAMFPGGCFNEAFIKYWSILGQGLDQTKGIALKAFEPIDPLMGKLAPKIAIGVKAVGEDRSDLERIAEIHKENKYPFDYGERVTFRDDPADDDGRTIDELSAFTKQTLIEKNNIPLYTWGSWWDSATADFVISRFASYKNPIKAVIGDWDHENFHKANPYFSHKTKISPDKEGMIKDWISFAENCIKGSVPEKALYYYTMGEETWKKTTDWPPSGQIMEKWFFNEKNTLNKSEPIAEQGYDEYHVQYDVTTGIRNRWYTLLGTHIFYPDREKQDKKSLIYTSDPIDEEIEITGHPIITLNLSSDHDDGMIHVQLEYIDEEDKIKWITDGQFRLVHRKISEERPPYKIFVPYHSFMRKDKMSLIPGTVSEIRFGLYPVSILVKKGFKLRVVISGGDKDTFARYPEEGHPILKVERNKTRSSFIELPIIRK